MQLTYFRVKMPKEKAITRFLEWSHWQPKEVQQVALEQAPDLLTEQVRTGIYVYETADWTRFEFIAGSCADITMEQWMEFAQDCPLYVSVNLFEDEKYRGIITTVENSTAHREYQSGVYMSVPEGVTIYYMADEYFLPDMQDGTLYIF